jgi:polyisoprenoid-binding protein YceI
VTRTVTLHAKLNALGRHPLPPFRRTAGFSATGTLSRKDFGMEHWAKVVGDEVRLILEVEATRDKDAGDGG